MLNSLQLSKFTGSSHRLSIRYKKYISPVLHLIDKPKALTDEDKKIRKKCLKAKDYAGCMEYEANR